MSTISYSVFTKPWKTQSLEELAGFVAGLGFDAVEYPLRDGYQVQPSDGAKGIVRLCRVLKAAGVAVASIAGGVDVRFAEGTNAVSGIDEGLFAGCGEAGVPVIRICQSLERGMGFHENIELIRRKYDALLPYCEKYGVILGVQPHSGLNISNAAETYMLLRDYDPKYIAAVWDSGHNGLAGSEPEVAIDTLWDMLCMVNFKAANRIRVNGPEAEEALWRVHWTTGRHADGSWRRGVEHLRRRGYRGVVCMPAEYSDGERVERYIKEDLAYIKELFAGY